MHRSFDAPGVRQAPALLAAAAAALAVALLGWWLVRPAAAPLESTLPIAGDSASTPVAEASEPGPTVDPGVAPSGVASSGGGDPDGGEGVVVQAAGSVREPGVHRLPPGARVDDLVRAAGGFAPDADRDRVNLAAPLVDGERVWVPARGQDRVPEVVAGSGGGAGGGAAVPGGTASGAGGAAGPVDLNRASAAELEALPGVGPATSAAILAHRDQIGRFTSVEQLLDVRGIGDAKLEQLRPLVRV